MPPEAKDPSKANLTLEQKQQRKQQQPPDEEEEEEDAEHVPHHGLIPVVVPHRHQ